MHTIHIDYAPHLDEHVVYIGDEDAPAAYIDCIPTETGVHWVLLHLADGRRATTPGPMNGMEPAAWAGKTIAAWRGGAQ